MTKKLAMTRVALKSCHQNSKTWRNQPKEIFKKKLLEGDFNLGAIKRLNLDSGVKQLLNPDLGLPESQDN